MAADSATRVTCFTCKCLNVKIKASKPVDAIHPELALEPGSVPVYVKQDGISVAHPQLTLRIRSKATPYDGQARSAQFMSLACLICRTLVYRVHQVVSSKLAAPEGPVIPKAGWVETEVLRTPSGWIEVFEDALADPDVTRQESSPRYSTLFSLILPPLVSELQSVPVEPSLTEPTSQSTVRYLDNMEPLFADMSNSSDLVFQHLSSIALQQSETLRKRAEQEVDDIIKSKIAQVAHIERELKLQVQTLLQAYRDGLRIIEEEGKPVSPTPKPWKDASTSSDVRAANSINEFIPSAVPPRRHSPETRKVSTLSASLVTSSFHHPKAVQDATGSRPSSLTSYSDNRASSHGGSLLDFKRINNEDLNTATTYRYFVIEEEMERVNAAKQPAVNAKADAKIKDAPQTPSTPPKPKRKVTFDLQPTSSDDAKVEERAVPDEGEMVFDLEDERGDDSERAADPALVLPFVEQSPNRTKSHRQSDAAGSLLASSSLSKEPVLSSRPSPLRVASSSPEQNTTVLPTSTGQRKAHSRGPSFEVPDDPSLPEQNGISMEGRLQDEYDEEIKKVLAAGTPSHRAAWKNGGKAWGQFLHRGRERIFDSDKLAGDASDDEDDDELRELEEEDRDEAYESAQANGIPGSMPIRIRTFGKKQEALSLASFRDRPQTLKATVNGT